MRKGNITVILVVLLAAVSVTFAYYYGTQQAKNNPPQPQPAKEEIQPPNAAPSLFPTAPPEDNIPAGWETYTNRRFGFEISYPPGYQVLTDSTNLYGWPNAVALLYNGGQSYDLPIEYWSSPAEYQKKYNSQYKLTVKQVGNTYITLVNINFDPEVDRIIATFRSL